MTARQPLSLATTVTALNATQPSRNVTRMLSAAKVAQPTGTLALVNLLLWAQDGGMPEVDPGWLEAVLGATELAESHDPAAVYDNLEAPGLESATTLREAATLVLQKVADLIPPGTQAP